MTDLFTRAGSGLSSCCCLLVAGGGGEGEGDRGTIEGRMVDGRPGERSVEGPGGGMTVCVCMHADIIEHKHNLSRTNSLVVGAVSNGDFFTMG